MSFRWLLISLSPCLLYAQDPELIDQQAVFSGSHLEEWMHHPLELNQASEQELKLIMADPQLLIDHRQKNGSLISVHELQQIMEPEQVIQLLPFIRVKPVQKTTGLESEVLWRVQQRVTDKDPALYSRIRLSDINGSRLELRAEKDAGEKGVDMLSGYLYYKRKRNSTVIGDYELRFGQGLLLWSGFGFGKGAEARFVQKTGSPIKPYTGLGEERFFRGIASSRSFGNFTLTPFVSFRKRDGRMDTLSTGYIQVLSLPLDGIHISKSQLNNKDVLQQWAYGMNTKYKQRDRQIGISMLKQAYAYPISSQQGQKDFLALSLDAKWQLGSLSLFSEAATNNTRSYAFLGGVLWATHPKVNMGILFRNYPKNYHSWYSLAFSSSSWGSAEQGLYYNLNIDIIRHWYLNIYTDIYYTNNASFLAKKPALGTDKMIQLSYRPNRKDEYLIRYQNRERDQDLKGNDQFHLKHQSRSQKHSFRGQLASKIATAWIYKTRIDISYQNNQWGKLSFQEVKWKPKLKYSWSVRYSLFAVDDWDNRLYSFEPSLPYSYANTAYGNTGHRISLLFKRKLGQISLWIKLSYGKETSPEGLSKDVKTIGLLGSWKAAMFQ